MRRIILMVMAGMLVALPLFAQTTTVQKKMRVVPAKPATQKRTLKKVAPKPAEAEVQSDALEPEAELPPDAAAQPVTEPEVQPLDRGVIEAVPGAPKATAPVFGTLEAEKFETKITKVLVHIKTADWKGAGTDEKISISFGCKEDDSKHENKCKYADLKLSHERSMNCGKDCDLFEQGNTDIFEINASKDAPGLTEKDLKYFIISMDTVGPAKEIKYAWLMEGLKIEYIEETIIGNVSKGERKHLAYWNPCMGRWMYRLHTWDIYGPSDTAVCAIVETSARDKAGTNDAVWLEFTDYKYDPSGHGHNPHYDYDSDILKTGYTAHFCEYYDKLYMRMGLRLARPLSMIGDGTLGSAPRRWGTMYDNYERGMRTSYGAYSYDRNFFSSTGGKPKRVSVVKEKDGKHGGFRMERLQVFVYQPAKDFKYADHCKPDQNCAVKLAGPIYYLDETFTGEEGHLSDSAGLRTKSLHFETLTQWTEELLPSRFSKIGSYF